MEIDLTAGIRPTFGPVTLDFSVTQYIDPNERRLTDLSGVNYTPANIDFTELAAKASWSATDRFTLGAGGFHAWDWLGSGAPGTYTNVTAKYALPPGDPRRSVRLGRTRLLLARYNIAPAWKRQLVDDAYWNVGIGFTKNDVTLDLRYHDTDLGKGECYVNTTDPTGIVTGMGRSNWCSAAFIATVSVDLTADRLKDLMPSN